VQRAGHESKTTASTHHHHLHHGDDGRVIASKVPGAVMPAGSKIVPRASGRYVCRGQAFAEVKCEVGAGYLSLCKPVLWSVGVNQNSEKIYCRFRDIEEK